MVYFINRRSTLALKKITELTPLKNIFFRGCGAMAFILYVVRWLHKLCSPSPEKKLAEVVLCIHLLYVKTSRRLRLRSSGRKPPRS
mmetsp:Transcript_5752/g.7268  ORF Transcript_5752/g.7268 Transcript_5752/m.7268 type:complete len:86 (+) Transcript_5752:710-967(+)